MLLTLRIVNAQLKECKLHVPKHLRVIKQIHEYIFCVTSENLSIFNLTVPKEWLFHEGRSRIDITYFTESCSLPVFNLLPMCAICEWWQHYKRTQFLKEKLRTAACDKITKPNSKGWLDNDKYSSTCIKSEIDLRKTVTEDISLTILTSNFND